MTWSVILSSSVVSAILGAVVKAIWDRRTAKKAAKTEMRAEAYRDFVVHVFGK